MEVSLLVDAEQGLLTVTYSGDFTLAEAEADFLDLLDTLVEHNLRKVLIDGRQLSGNPELLERFYYGTFVADAVNRTVNRTGCAVPAFAYVLEKPMLHANRFGETVAVNRGMRVRAFDNLQQARWWLGVDRRLKAVTDETKTTCWSSFVGLNTGRDQRRVRQNSMSLTERKSCKGYCC